jgi:iron complex outermembrane receptor protein
MGALSWSVGGTVEWGRGLAPFASIGTAFETPTTTELVNRPTGGGGLNPELDPQRSIMIEAGARGDVGTATRYRVAFYGARTTDALIPFEVPSEPGRQFYRNAGVTRTRGIELEVEARPWPALRAAVTYTVQDARFVEFESPGGTFDGNAVPGAPRHHLIWALDLAVGGGVWAIVEGTHASAQYADDANSARAEGWWTADVRVGWWYARRGVSLEPFVAVRNLLDRRYAASVVVNAAGGRYYEPAPGRTAMAGVKVGW